MKFLILWTLVSASVAVHDKYFIAGRNGFYSWNDVSALCKKFDAVIAAPRTYHDLYEMSCIAREDNRLNLMFTGIKNINNTLLYADKSKVAMAIHCYGYCVSPAFWSYGQYPVNTIHDFWPIYKLNDYYNLVTPICEVKSDAKKEEDDAKLSAE